MFRASDEAILGTLTYVSMQIPYYFFVRTSGEALYSTLNYCSVQTVGISKTALQIPVKARKECLEKGIKVRYNLYTI